MPRRALLALAVAACLLGGCSRPAKCKYRIAVIPKGLIHEFGQSGQPGGTEGPALDFVFRCGGIPAVTASWPPTAERGGTCSLPTDSARGMLIFARSSRVLCRARSA